MMIDVHCVECVIQSYPLILLYVHLVYSKIATAIKYDTNIIDYKITILLIMTHNLRALQA